MSHRGELGRLWASRKLCPRAFTVGIGCCSMVILETMTMLFNIFDSLTIPQVLEEHLGFFWKNNIQYGPIPQKRSGKTGRLKVPKQIEFSFINSSFPNGWFSIGYDQPQMSLWPQHQGFALMKANHTIFAVTYQVGPLKMVNVVNLKN